MIAAYICNLRIGERTLYTGEVADCYIFSWEVHSLHHHDWIPDNAAIREELKENVPPEDRGWDSAEKRWSVKVGYREILSRMFSNFDAEAHALEAQGSLF